MKLLLRVFTGPFFKELFNGLFKAFKLTQIARKHTHSRKIQLAFVGNLLRLETLNKLNSMKHFKLRNLTEKRKTSLWANPRR